MIRILLVKFIVLMTICLTPAMSSAQSSSKAFAGQTYLRVKPLTYLWGAHLGLEYTTNDKISVVGDLTVHGLYIGLPNAALSAELRWYMLGNPRAGLYSSLRAVGGYFWDAPAVEQRPFYAGGGIGAGVVGKLSSRVGLWFDLGFKYAHVFGTKVNKSHKDHNFGFVYYAFIGPASVIDTSIGLAIQI
ncbi:MAG: hypothetical protein Q4A64_08355 [Porphyromonadaceae bacterium]|nr:hypothetical protein [Porphyromonadaceae bacterium]